MVRSKCTKHRNGLDECEETGIGMGSSERGKLEIRGERVGLFVRHSESSNLLSFVCLLPPTFPIHPQLLSFLSFFSSTYLHLEQQTHFSRCSPDSLSLPPQSPISRSTVDKTSGRRKTAFLVEFPSASSNEIRLWCSCAAYLIPLSHRQLHFPDTAPTRPRSP